MSYRLWIIEFLCAAIVLAFLSWFWESLPIWALFIGMGIFFYFVFRASRRTWRGLKSKSSAP